MTTVPNRRPSRRQPKIVLERDTIEQLEALAEGAMRRTPELADRLLTELSRAKIVAKGKLGVDIVTLGRAVTFRDETSGKVQTVTLVLPEQADISQGRASLMTPMGVALIGLSVGMTFRWITRDGEERSLTVLEVHPDAGVAETAA